MTADYNGWVDSPEVERETVGLFEMRGGPQTLASQALILRSLALLSQSARRVARWRNR